MHSYMFKIMGHLILDSLKKIIFDCQSNNFYPLSTDLAIQLN